jgi:ribonuclease-3
MAASPTEVIQRRIGYVFGRPDLLRQALTHKSYVNETRDAGSEDNERLEFLGDAVLALVISDYLAASLPGSPEGELSQQKARLVSEPSLARAARRLDLGHLLRLGRGEEMTQGREKPSILADALEALIAAIYLDGGLEEARAFTLRVFAPELGGQQVQGDYKTRLQEWCQKHGEGLPRYATVGETGPDHQKTFEVDVLIQGAVAGTGIGRTKKEAEQMAARRALERRAHGEPTPGEPTPGLTGGEPCGRDCDETA